MRKKTQSTKREAETVEPMTFLEMHNLTRWDQNNTKRYNEDSKTEEYTAGEVKGRIKPTQN